MPFFNTSEIESRDLFPGVHAKIFHGDNVTVANVLLDKGSVVPEHSHVHEQIINVLDGTFELTVDGETKTVSAGHVAVVPSNVKHSLLTITSGKILDVFHPVREDLKQIS